MEQTGHVWLLEFLKEGVKVANHFEAHDSSSGHPFPQSEPTLGLDTFPQSELDVRRGLVFWIYTVAD